MWLLDPYDLTITNSGTGAVDGSGNFTSDNTTSTIKPTTIATALLSSDVTITTGSGGGGAGDLTVQDPIVVALGALTRTLTLNAENNIDVSASITCVTGSLNVTLNANQGGGSGHVAVAADIDTDGGSLIANGDAFDNTGGVITTLGGDITLTQTGAVTIGDDLNAGSGNVTSAAAAYRLARRPLLARPSPSTRSARSPAAIRPAILPSPARGPSLLSGTDLGTAINPLALSLGNGSGQLTATSGGLYVAFDGTITTSQLSISVAGVGQTISLATTSGDIAVDSTLGFDNNTADDALTLTSAGAIAFTGGTLTAASATLPRRHHDQP